MEAHWSCSTMLFKCTPWSRFQVRYAPNFFYTKVDGSWRSPLLSACGVPWEQISWHEVKRSCWEGFKVFEKKRFRGISRFRFPNTSRSGRNGNSNLGWPPKLPQKYAGIYDYARNVRALIFCVHTILSKSFFPITSSIEGGGRLASFPPWYIC